MIIINCVELENHKSENLFVCYALRFITGLGYIMGWVYYGKY